MTREKVLHYPDVFRLFHISTLLRSVELEMRKESRIILHLHTSEKFRTKDEKGFDSRALVASAGHFEQCVREDPRKKG